MGTGPERLKRSRTALIALLLGLSAGFLAGRTLFARPAAALQYKSQTVVALGTDAAAKVGQAIQENAGGGWRFASQSVFYRPDNGQAIYVLVFEK